MIQKINLFLGKLKNLAPKPFPNGTVLNFGVFGKYDVAHYHSSEQGENAELKFYHAIEVADPKFVILVGIACGAGAPQKIGEVLVSRRILDYNERKEDSCLFDNEKPEEPVSRIRGVEVSSGSHLSGLFYGLLAGWIKDNVKAYYDCIISSCFLVNHPKLKKEVFEAANTKLGKEAAIGYEMEGVPLYRACHDHKITEWIVVKAISDWGDGTKNKDEEQYFVSSLTHRSGSRKKASRSETGRIVGFYGHNGYEWGVRSS